MWPVEQMDLGMSRASFSIQLLAQGEEWHWELTFGDFKLFNEPRLHPFSALRFSMPDCPQCVTQKYKPLDLRAKKTRAIRRRLTKHQVRLYLHVSSSPSSVRFWCSFLHLKFASCVGSPGRLLAQSQTFCDSVSQCLTTFPALNCRIELVCMV